MFLTQRVLSDITWQAFERILARLLIHQGFDGVRLVGQSGDGGADILASKHGKRWLFQVKRWASRVGVATIDRTIQALATYRADVPVIVSLNGFDEASQEQQRVLLGRRIPLQLWDRFRLLSLAAGLKDINETNSRKPRDYQRDAIDAITAAYSDGRNRALVVLATGLGKTFVAAEWYRRLYRSGAQSRLLVLAHTNDLVYQLERAFWGVLGPKQDTIIWNGLEHPSPDTLAEVNLVFACIPTVYESLLRNGGLAEFDVVIVDECHHAGTQMYNAVLDELRAAAPDGPFLLGLTATPWRADGVDVAASYFGPPVISVDLVTGLKRGFLANVDYRMYTDNIDWTQLSQLNHGVMSPRRINRTLFIDNWDDGVIDALQAVWREQSRPRAIVFCGTIDHAVTVRDRINARQFCSAQAIYSASSDGKKMSAIERNKILADFQDGEVDVVCAVDIFNEGIDVPDVNIIVFQRVTHSRRIFIQQLGRGLRLSAGKEKVIVLDFVSDIRRFAAGIDLKRQLSEADERDSRSIRVRLKNEVSFRRLGHSDAKGETFLQEWLVDVATIEDAGEDASVLRFPPMLA